MGAEFNEDQIVIELADEELKIVTRKELAEMEKEAREFDGFEAWIVRGKVVPLNMEPDPYSYFPQCNVEGCEGVSCSGGTCWSNTGYWNLCPKHAQEFADGKPQPKMKQSAIDREKSRGADGVIRTSGKPDLNGNHDFSYPVIPRHED